MSANALNRDEKGGQIMVTDKTLEIECLKLHLHLNEAPDAPWLKKCKASFGKTLNQEYDHVFFKEWSVKISDLTKENWQKELKERYLDFVYNLDNFIDEFLKWHQNTTMVHMLMPLRYKEIKFDSIMFEAIVAFDTE